MGLLTAPTDAAVFNPNGGDGAKGLGTRCTVRSPSRHVILCCIAVAILYYTYASRSTRGDVAITETAAAPLAAPPPAPDVTAASPAPMSPPAATEPRYHLPPGPPSKRVQMVWNREMECEYEIDAYTNFTPRKRNAAQLDTCGGPVTRSPPELRYLPDPMLDCSEYTTAFYLASFWWNGGYAAEVPAAETLVRETLGAPIHHLFSDYGCYTASRGPRNTVVARVATDWVGVTPAGQIVDMASVWLSRNYHSDELVAIGRDAQFISNAKKAQRLAKTLIDSHIGGRFVHGDAVVLPAQYQAELMGQQFQEFFASLARAYTSGLFSKPNLTVVLPHSRDADDHALRSWVEPLLQADGMTVLWLEPNRALHVERPWFVPVPHIEMTDPCSTVFTTGYLLPRALKRLRSDRTFPFGDEGARFNENVSDEAWARTLPKKIAIIKQNIHARHRRAFIVGDVGHAMLHRLGYVWIEDNSPFLWRVLLISYCDVLLTTHGALQAINSRMWAGYAPLRAEGVAALRVISLMHPNYQGELAWWAPFPSRTGHQQGLRVVVSNLVALGAMNMWVKSVVVDGRELRPEFVPLAVLVFEASDCTIDPSAAADFPSSHVPRISETDVEHRPSRLNASWASIPKYGLRCRQPVD
jgi:hypothetical protein